VWFLLVMRQMIIIADGGGTKTRAEAVIDESSLHEMVAGPCVPYMDLDRALGSIRLIRDTVLARAGLSRTEVKIAMALASAGLDSPSIALQFERKLLEIVDELSLVSDGEAALEACCGNSPGAVIAIGTGVAITARSGDGRFIALDGWGWPAGDRGGGAWTGRQVVEHFLSAHDRDELHADPFHRFLTSRIGGERGEILDWLGSADRTGYAAMAQLAIDWADKGSSAARAAILQATEEIGKARQSLVARGIERIHVTGGFGEALQPFLDQGSFQFIKDAPFHGARLRASRWLPTLQETKI
jgi:glucosamine kinase